MPISTRMDKEVVAHKHNGILLSYKKEHIWVSSNEVNKTGACYTEWSISETETPTQHINTYMWNLERWWWPYMQDSKRYRCKQQTFRLSGRWGWYDFQIAMRHVYYHIQNRWPVRTVAWIGHSKLVLWDNPERWGGKAGRRGAQEWGDTCTPMADSYWWMANKITIL